MVPFPSKVRQRLVVVYFRKIKDKQTKKKKRILFTFSEKNNLAELQSNPIAAGAAKQETCPKPMSTGAISKSRLMDCVNNKGFSSRKNVQRP